MTITPFLTLRLRRKKDTLLARQRARRVASLLGYDVVEQACIAAGTFVIACQAIERFGAARLTFQLEDGQLLVSAKEWNERPAGNRIMDLLHDVDQAGLFRLVKQLPAEQNIEERDLGWLVHQVEDAACEGIFEEVVKQNQEMLMLLHELRLFQADSMKKGEKTRSPHAA